MEILKKILEIIAQFLEERKEKKVETQETKRLEIETSKKVEKEIKEKKKTEKVKKDEKYYSDDDFFGDY